MRETRLSDSEGGAAQANASLLPLSQGPDVLRFAAGICTLKVNAVVTLDREGALKRAAEAGTAQPGGQGLPFGFPFTVKDNIETAGMRTTASHPPLKDNVPDHDATVVARMKAAGAVLMGKTNLPQLAMDFQIDSPLFGRANNPPRPRAHHGGAARAGPPPRWPPA